ncbi:HAD family hydrolase [Agathobaculum sp. LCP25S3_E8]|uniref:HAD family hydrolase n=1 Tax=Agathobaculum sp. LCP25S3_E8 TaxID=3438735 RepID=UPI003F91DED4
MINTVLFDMGGTLEDIWYNDQTVQTVTGTLLDMLREHGLNAGCTEVAFWNRLNSGILRYKKWSEVHELEKKPEEIWPEFYLADFDIDKRKVADIAEKLAGIWEVTYYHRELRPGVKQMLETLRERGYKLGVISNTASLYSVFDVLEGYGIRDYFSDVTLSSVTGYRKPHPSIFRIALRQMQARPEECAYVGDTLSRDVIGAKRLHFGAAIQIHSFLSAQKDAAVADVWQPDRVVENIGDVVDYLDELNHNAQRLHTGA